MQLGQPGKGSYSASMQPTRTTIPWNAWREQHPALDTPDLREINLAGVWFSGRKEMENDSMLMEERRQQEI
ncbi:hypothetical protein KSF_011680 [Reticulibacter mediterranei]|uniref:Uncharacterized protein n=1 Tax=Reticulibacter mediterranei TaxID=2778369 RepID=A0A8J3N0D1_9CHLR|nr:hypothetical protein KSF_011680 [Reticulibacter mediterranei]